MSLDELKEFVRLHARAQGMSARRCARVLDQITTADGDGPASWVGAWSRAGDLLAARGAHLAACRHYNLARFPYVDGEPRARALRLCVEHFGRWARPRGMRHVSVDLAGRPFAAWTSADPRRPRPLLVVVGGIVSVKEQWGQLLPAARRLGMAIAVTELPGVGENDARYGRQSWRMLPALLDRLAGEADVDRSYVLGLSFGGHLALRAAAHDPRVRGIATVGPPVADFFTDRAWWDRLPSTTSRTLAHATGVAPAALPDHLAGWAIEEAELTALTIPVYAVASARDEIIPPADVAALRRHVPHLRLLTHDDVHGSPHHLAATRLWIAWSLLRMRRARPVPRPTRR